MPAVANTGRLMQSTVVERTTVIAPSTTHSGKQKQ